MDDMPNNKEGPLALRHMLCVIPHLLRDPYPLRI